MSSCTKIRKKKRQVCLGDMRDVITLNLRDIEEPDFDTVDFTENFTPLDETNPQILSMVETVSGSTWFDGVNTEVPITHHVYIVYNPLVTAEIWITLDDTDKRLDILDVEDLDERHQFQLLRCNDRGQKAQAATEA